MTETSLPVRVNGYTHELVIIQPGAQQLLVFQRETQGLDEVQPATGIGAQSDDIAGVGGNFRLVEDYVEHRT